MYCIYCGAKLPDDALFCTACGESVAVEQSAPKKKSFLKRFIIFFSIISMLVVMLAGSMGVYYFLSNTYKTPLNNMIAMINMKQSDNMIDDIICYLNGFSEKEFDRAHDLLKQSEYYEDFLVAEESSLKIMVNFFEGYFGEDYKFSFRLEDKSGLSKNALDEIKYDIDRKAGEIKDFVDQTKKYTTKDWDKLAEHVGLARNQTKDLVRLLEDIYEKWDNAEITEGYKLNVIFVVNGSELDEPLEEKGEFEVFKADGRWVSMEFIDMAYDLVCNIIE